MQNVRGGELVFIPSAPGGFLPARVLTLDPQSNTAEVEVEPPSAAAGDVRCVPCGDLRARFAPEEGVTSDDNTALEYMNDATILENLRVRHQQDKIYTYTASVLLAVNPYKDIGGLYGEEQCLRYKGRHIGALPPHPYAIADTAYRALMREQRDQGLLISGESGAGKTETSKIMTQYLAFASGAAAGHASGVQERVLRAQPILESFGNAVTMRNSNSSRFGKYSRIYFDRSGTFVDAGISTYLLESSRVVVHGEGERTYHCFYELLRGGDDVKLEALGLERNRRYRLLHGANDEPLPGFDARDGVHFARLCDALKTVGMDDGAVDSALRVLAGLIHLGDIELKENSPTNDGNEVEVDCEHVGKAARMLGMDADELRSRLTRRRVAVRGRSSFHEVPRSASQFRHALQSLIKALYKRLFERTVRCINDSFRERSPGGAEGGGAAGDGGGGRRHIGILDIYGFERLQRNSFEQLCINLTNERLQQYFVEHALRAEQRLYEREGLPWVGLALPDAQPVFNAIGQVLKALDECSENLFKGVGNATDKTFCQRVLDEAAKDVEHKEVLKQVKMSGGGRRSIGGRAPNEGFVIRHYAGHVEYNTAGWLDKNNDRLLPECEELICESTDPLVRSFGEEDSGKAQFRSISRKYTKDLESLLETLGECNLHYIRCFKPNSEQKPDVFDNRLVLEQIVQCGTVELVKIMHDGFPNRCAFDEIATRFRDLLPERFQRYGMRTFIEALMLAHSVPKEQWALGMSKLFLRAGQLHALEGVRSQGAVLQAEKLADIVQRIVRQRWARAVHSVALCNYLPRFLSEIHATREARRLRRLAASRRFKGTLRVFMCLRAEWVTMRAKRYDRLAVALHLAALLHVRMRTWAARARATIKRKRNERLAAALHLAAVLYVRVHAWGASAQATVKRRRADRCAAKVQLAGLLHVRLRSWGATARAAIKQKRMGRWLSALHLAVVLHVRLRAWRARAQASIKRKRSERLFAAMHLAALVHVRPRTWVAKARASLKSKRYERAAAALHLAALLHLRSRSWLAGARLRLAQAARQRELDRQREEEEEEERLRCEDEARQREECERVETVRVQEERRRREEEGQQEEAEKRRRQELPLGDEAPHEGMGKKGADSKAPREGQPTALEEERRRRTILAQATPQKKAMREVGRAADRAPKQQAQAVAAPATSGPPSTDCRRGDSKAADHRLGTPLGPHASVKREIRAVDETVRRFEVEIAQKEAALKQEMARLHDQNATLQLQLVQDRRPQHHGALPVDGHEGGGEGKPCASPACCKAAPAAAAEPHSQKTPECLSTGKKAPRQTCARASQSYSLLSLHGNPEARQKRHSVAHEALRQQQVPLQRRPSVSGGPGGGGDLGSQRKWWTEQRQFLLDDLYGGSPQALRAAGVSIQHEVRSDLSQKFQTAEDAPVRSRRSSVVKKQPTKIQWSSRCIGR